MIKELATAAATAAIGLAVAPAAHADDAMYRVGVEIQPGEYRYVVTGASWGAWRTCSDASCDAGSGAIDLSGPIDGIGTTGYFTVPASAKYVKTKNLRISAA